MPPANLAPPKALRTSNRTGVTTQAALTPQQTQTSVGQPNTSRTTHPSAHTPLPRQIHPPQDPPHRLQDAQDQPWLWVGSDPGSILWKWHLSAPEMSCGSSHPKTNSCPG
eukprot:EG_transcript_52743